ncbi:MAG: GNAT family N-acetyltransferase [Oscillatoriales cyanobacterium C42_A2020_001]|nr:GNAT family N-acetyltransferase [Leptolyngbyaceae cyanobacterium C42_A2020_001]
MTDHSNLTFRLAEERDRTQFINLARLSFMPTMTLADAEQEWGESSINPPGRKGWVVEDAAGNLVARYRHLEFELFFEGVRFPVAGVGGVAVAIAHRGKGLAQWMLTQALKDFREQEILLSMLYPFQHGFYRKLGWTWMGATYQFPVSSRHLPLYTERHQIAAYQPSQEAALKALYEKVAMQHNGWLHRESWWWENFFKPRGGRELYCYAEAEELRGYVVLEFTQLEPEKEQLAVVVREWVAVNAAAYRGIVGFLASLRDQITTIVWNTFPDDPFPYLLKEQQRDPALTVPPFDFNYMHQLGLLSGGFMWRLVDVQRAIALRPIQPVPPFTLSFDIADPVFGNEQFTVEFANDTMQLTSRPAATVLKTSVHHLAELFSGLRRSQQLHWTGELELEGDDALLAQLDSAWNTQPPFCWDAF